jgi:hypothetical protein
MDKDKDALLKTERHPPGHLTNSGDLAPVAEHEGEKTERGREESETPCLLLPTFFDCE